MAMLIRGLLKLAWLETKIFSREPMGLFGTLAVPVLLFVLVGRFGGDGVVRWAQQPGGAIPAFLPVLASIMMTLGAVGSLVTIISIYREGGILKRLRATPLSPVVILSAHVLVKLVFTAITLVLLVAAGRRFYPMGAEVPLVSFGLALLLSTWAILSVGFLVASVVPTARFAQPFAGVILWAMLGLSGLFFPLERLPPVLAAAAHALPLTYAVSLLNGIWMGEGWAAHLGDVAGLVVIFALVTAVSSRVFRWE